jgi:hypothetical protein
MTPLPLAHVTTNRQEEKGHFFVLSVRPSRALAEPGSVGAWGLRGSFVTSLSPFPLFTSQNSSFLLEQISPLSGASTNASADPLFSILSFVGVPVTL